MLLTAEEQDRVTDRASRLEATTGVQVVAAVVGKSDAYPEIPWRAFALGTAAAVLALTGAAVAGGPATVGSIVVGVLVLAAGAIPALLTVFCPPFARLFLHSHRAEAEVRQHAESLFRVHGLDRTRARIGVLLLVSLFERRVMVLPDVAVRDRVSDAELAGVIGRLVPLAARGEVATALTEGLLALEALLTGKGFRGAGGPDEIPDTLVQEKGE